MQLNIIDVIAIIISIGGIAYFLWMMWQFISSFYQIFIKGDWSDNEDDDKDNIKQANKTRPPHIKKYQYCPYCGENFETGKTYKKCPYCKESLVRKVE